MACSAPPQSFCGLNASSQVSPPTTVYRLSCSKYLRSTSLAGPRLERNCHNRKTYHNHRHWLKNNHYETRSLPYPFLYNLSLPLRLLNQQWHAVRIQTAALTVGCAPVPCGLSEGHRAMLSAPRYGLANLPSGT